jgi:hypothetical protein
MCSAAAPSRSRNARPLALLALLAALLVNLAALPASAQSDPDAFPLPPLPGTPEAWLVTYGPGEIYWQRFGHNAIWLREPGGLDHTFNFGFFDFDQENFLLRFVQGRMRYFAAAMPAEREFAFYRQEGRKISAQRLDLTPEAYVRLREHLLWHVAPENREYRYDYYLDNCSTRVRDALDLGLGGALSQRFRDEPAGQNFRDHTRRSTEGDLDYYLGLVGALGRPVDRPINRWEEMFLPAVLATGVADFRTPSTGGDVPLVLETRVFAEAAVPQPPERPGRTWPLYGAIGLVLAGLGWLAARSGRRTAVDGMAFAWLMIGGTLGIGLAAAWALTDHSVARDNANLLLLSPLWLLGLVPRLRRVTAGLMVAGTGMALGMAIWPGGQYLADTLALLAPINLAVAARLPNTGRAFRSGPAPA